MVKCSASSNEECRSFKILGSGIAFEGGRYVAKYVSTAAKRAGTKLFQRAMKSSEYSNKKSIKFILGETTKGSKKITYAYEVMRMMLDKPKVIVRDGVSIKYKYKYIVNRLNTIPTSTELNM